MVIIGITGTLGAGKGTIVEYLVSKKGFLHFSVRAFVTEEIEKRGLEVNRDSMVMVANDMRAKHGPAYMAEALFEKAAVSGKNCIIESIRTPAEVEILKQKSTFHLFAVDARPEIRYKRIRVRGSETDKVSYQDFLDNEEREMSSTDPNHQNIHKCIEKADFVFNNDKNISDLHKQLDRVLNEILP